MSAARFTVALVSLSAATVESRSAIRMRAKRSACSRNRSPPARTDSRSAGTARLSPIRPLAVAVKTDGYHRRLADSPVRIVHRLAVSRARLGALDPGQRPDGVQADARG